MRHPRRDTGLPLGRGEAHAQDHLATQGEDGPSGLNIISAKLCSTRRRCIAPTVASDTLLAASPPSPMPPGTRQSELLRAIAVLVQSSKQFSRRKGNAVQVQKDGSAVDSFLLNIDKKSLRERTEDIKYIANCSKKSHLLNEHSNSNKLSAKHTDMESISIQKDIDDLYRSIERNVFGREKDRKHTCGLLRKGPNAEAASSSTSKCYSVFGGKSTLAQYICDYEEAEGNHFNLVMFIHVSKTFRLDDIFRDMLEQISQSRPADTKGLKSLCKELKGKLKSRCFLLVLDDLWVHYGNQKEWHIFLDTVNAGQHGSRILVTSQTKDAAAALGAQEQIPIPDLGEDHYLSLFMHHAIQAGSVDDDVEYERIGRRIVEKLPQITYCSGNSGKKASKKQNLRFLGKNSEP